MLAGELDGLLHMLQAASVVDSVGSTSFEEASPGLGASSEACERVPHGFQIQQDAKSTERRCLGQPIVSLSLGPARMPWKQGLQYNHLRETGSWQGVGISLAQVCLCGLPLGS